MVASRPHPLSLHYRQLILLALLCYGISSVNLQDPLSESRRNDRNNNQRPYRNQPSRSNREQNEPSRSNREQNQPFESKPNQDEPPALSRNKNLPPETNTDQNKPSASKPIQDEPSRSIRNQNQPSQSNQKQRQAFESTPDQNKPAASKPSQDEPSRSNRNPNQPSESNPNQNQPSGSNPNRNQPSDTNPNENQPSESNQNQNPSSRTRPNENQPSESDPNQNEPNPSQNKPSESNSNQNKPPESNPNQNQPSRSSPNENQPSRSRPDQSQPSLSRPNQNRPSQSRPYQEQRTTYRPDPPRQQTTRPYQNRRFRTRPTTATTTRSTTTSTTTRSTTTSTTTTTTTRPPRRYRIKPSRAKDYFSNSESKKLYKKPKTNSSALPEFIQDTNLNKTICHNGKPNAYLTFDLKGLSSHLVLPSVKESLTLQWHSDQPDGLIYYQEQEGRKIYIGLKNGSLVFVNQYLPGGDKTTVLLGGDVGKTFTDQAWHRLDITRAGQKIVLRADNLAPKTLTLKGKAQFLTKSLVQIGGTKNVDEATDGHIKRNFIGGINMLMFHSEVREHHFYNNTLNLLVYVTRDTEGVEISDKMCFTDLHAITFLDDRSYMTIPGFSPPKIGDTLSLGVRTTKPDAILLHSDGRNGDPKLTLELYNGDLYLVLEEKGKSNRTKLQPKINDGKSHNISLSFEKDGIEANVTEVEEPDTGETGDYPSGSPSVTKTPAAGQRDDRTTKKPFTTTLSTNRNSGGRSRGKRQVQDLDQEEGNVMYIGGVPDMDSLPWHTWARQNYQGCLKDIRKNGEPPLNLKVIIQNQKSLNEIASKCKPVWPRCTDDYCANGGRCVEMYEGRKCDCTHTDFRGPRCTLDAYTGMFLGDRSNRLSFRPQQCMHTYKVSLRLKTFKAHGFLFQTRARDGAGYMRAEILGGKLLLTTYFANKKKELSVGMSLDDNEWHWLEVTRLGDHLSLKLDAQLNHTILPGDGYYHCIDDVFLGSFSPRSMIAKFGRQVAYFGFVRNFFIDKFDILEEMKASGDPNILTDRHLPWLIHKDVTFTTYQSYVSLEPLGLLSATNLSISFKTFDESGIIMFSTNTRQGADSLDDLFLVELFSGRLLIKYDNPSGINFDVQTPVKYNDGKWHNLTISFRQDELLVNIDRTHSKQRHRGLSRLSLEGKLYLGSIPSRYLKTTQVRKLAAAKQGFRGCMASVVYRKSYMDLFQDGKNDGVLDGCQDIKSKCSKDTCQNGGVCQDFLHNGTTWCDCCRTGYSGPACADEPRSYYLRSDDSAAQNATLLYTYPPEQRETMSEEDLVFGVMTNEKNGSLLRLDSAILEDFVQLKLVNGYVAVDYNTNNQGVATSLTNDKVMVSDSRYHVVHFTRQPNKAMLRVDDQTRSLVHITTHDHFNALGSVTLGGVSTDQTTSNKGRSFDGIIGGLCFNGDSLYFDVTKDILATHPFKLGTRKIRQKGVWEKDVQTFSLGEVASILPGRASAPVVPGDVGGGGIAMFKACGPGSLEDDKVGVMLYPDGSGAAAYSVKASSATGGSASAGAGAGGGSSCGAGVAAVQGVTTQRATAMSGIIPIFPLHGPRAGAFIGFLLGFAIFISSLMWAFIRCKPGCCGVVRDDEFFVLDETDAGYGGGSKLDVSSIREEYIAFIPGEEVPDEMLVTSAENTPFIPAEEYRSTVTTNQQFSPNKYATLQHQSTKLHSQQGYNLTMQNRFASLPQQYKTTQLYSNSTTADYDYAVGGMTGGMTGGVTGGMTGGVTGGVYPASPRYVSSTLPLPQHRRTRSTSHSSMTNHNAMYHGGNVSPMIVTPGPMGELVRVDSCCVTANGRSVVTGSSLGPPQVWNLADGQLLCIMEGEPGMGSTFLHLVCNESLLVGAVNADLAVNEESVPKGVHNYLFQIWDVETGQPLGQSEPQVCSALCLMSDCDKVVLGRTENMAGMPTTTVVVWDLIANQPIKTICYEASVGNEDFLSNINISENDRFVIAGFRNSLDNQTEFVVFDMTLTSYNVSDPYIMRLDTSPDCLAVLPNDEVVCGLKNGDLIIWSLRGLSTVRQLQSLISFRAHRDQVTVVTRSKDANYLVSASVDRTLMLWDLKNERLLATLTGHKDQVWCAAISPDNDMIVSGSRDGSIRLWKVLSAQSICVFNAGVDIFQVYLSQDKRTIVGLGDKHDARKLIMLQVVASKIKKHVLV